MAICIAILAAMFFVWAYLAVGIFGAPFAGSQGWLLIPSTIVTGIISPKKATHPIVSNKKGVSFNPTTVNKNTIK